MEEDIDLLEDALYEHHHLVVDPKQSLVRIDKFITDKLSQVSRHKVQLAIEAGFITVNEKVTKANYKVKPADHISISLPTPPRGEAQPENIPLEIVYEDDDLLLVNKSAGMVVHPAYNHWEGTLVNALLYHFSQLPKNADGRPGLVHRIDKDTSGLLVVAKTEEALVHLARQFYDHSITRTYQALVWGCPTNTEGTVNVPLGRSQKDRRIVEAYPIEKYGVTPAKNAITHYKVLKNLHYVSLLECRLETGRTHQIRAHMKYLGHPIFNDATYNGDKILRGTVFSAYKAFVENCFKMIPRQALHAKSLGFIHPTTHQYMYFETPLPDDFQQVLGKWEKYIQ
ncbi:MAG: RluA family pseudouridine synthase [Cytophagales bacterium]|nr:MAG: RluA family pseudouridine synthase [Cytophagales bacterium]